MSDKKNNSSSNSSNISNKSENERDEMSNSTEMENGREEMENSSFSNKSNNSMRNNANNKFNNNGKEKKTKKKKGLFEGTLYKKARNSVKSGKNSIKSLFNTSKAGLVSAEDYKKELIQKEEEKKQQEKAAEAQGVYIDPETGTPMYPPVELDDFLRGRRELKREEFKKLQREQGFYFSDAMEEYVLNEQRKNEGLYLLGVNLNALLDLIRTPLKSNMDPLESGKSYELIGEYVDMGDKYDKILEDKVGLRMGPDRVVKPEDVFYQDSSFEEILKEGRNYTGLNKKYLSPKTLVNMVRILDKYKKNEIQWLRVATAVEIIYRYLHNEGETREEFFELDNKLEGKNLLELEEFFKTDHLFMTLKELRDFKKDLQFYKFPKDKTRNNTTTKAINNTKSINNTKAINNSKSQSQN